MGVGGVVDRVGWSAGGGSWLVGGHGGTVASGVGDIVDTTLNAEGVGVAVGARTRVGGVAGLLVVVVTTLHWVHGIVAEVVGLGWLRLNK